MRPQNGQPLFCLFHDVRPWVSLAGCQPVSHMYVFQLDTVILVDKLPSGICNVMYFILCKYMHANVS